MDCDLCGDWPAVRCTAATAYHWDKQSGEENPNKDLFLCYDCRDDYYDYWNERWSEYYSMVL